MSPFVIFLIGISFGMGLVIIFNLILKRRVSDVEDYYDAEFDIIREEILYMEKVISILNDDIQYLYDEDEISTLNKVRKQNIDDILDIISKDGISALTDEQKKFLDDYRNEN